MSRSLPVLIALAMVLPGGLAAQDPDSVSADTAATAEQPLRPGPTVNPAVVDTASMPASPGSAMIRSMILPGWGQSKFQAYFRGSVYFAGWVGNWFMNFKNAYRLDNARTQFDVRSDQIRAGLLASSGNPDSMAAQIDSFPEILDTAIQEDSLGNDLQKLVRARRQQREDWIAWSLFWVLASGIDAFVTAHLYDFPADVQLRPTGGRGAALTVSVPFPAPGGRQLRAAGAALPAPAPPRAPPSEGGMPDSR